jgi:hypothetical protein
MKCKCHPDSPFHWAEHKRDSIFMSDYVFRAKGAEGKSGSQIASDFVETQRGMGRSPGTIKNLGAPITNKEKEQALTAYKQFGIYSRAQPNVKPSPNKHEL